MEVLPHAAASYVGEADYTQPNLRTESYNEDSNCINRVAAVGECKLITGNERTQLKAQGAGLEIDDTSTSIGHHSGTSNFNFHLEGYMRNMTDDDLNAENPSYAECYESPLASESSHSLVNTIENESQSNSGDGESMVLEPKWLEQDESVAVWAKWRGQWQAGIRCARADCPLSTLRAKPTHDRKKYFVIFFPHTRNYCWADLHLVRPINELPLPIAHNTHDVGLELVKDLQIARHFIMRKLVVGMLSIIDQLPTEALIESSRDVIVWKEFAMNASHCGGYNSLSRMLIKLQKMIVQHFVSLDWRQLSYDSWVLQCQNADSAESVELLTEQLTNSIYWKEVNTQSDTPAKSYLGSVWKTWKHEVMKWFSPSHHATFAGELVQNCDGSLSSSINISRKRPKLEVRRADSHASQVETKDQQEEIAVNIDSRFFDGRGIADDVTLLSESYEKDVLGEGNVTLGCQGVAADNWGEIVVEASNPEFTQVKEVELTPKNEACKKLVDLQNNGRQCAAFIEAKGRMCGRFANDGDVYCCVHLASRFAGKSGKPRVSHTPDTPMCGGTTTLGTRCKHRSLQGSSFCKKHGPLSHAHLPENKLKRKLDDKFPSIVTNSCRDIVLAGGVESPLEVEPVSVIDSNAIGGLCTRRMVIGEESKHADDLREPLHCIGLFSQEGNSPCLESPKRHSLYCDKHLPSWLKRARNGKSRIVTRDIFIDLLKNCGSLEQKLHLHQACDLFYKFYKGIVSLRNPVPREVQLEWVTSEASENPSVGELLLKLIFCEKERLQRLWGFTTDKDKLDFTSVAEEPSETSLGSEGTHKNNSQDNKCKICSEEFIDDQLLGTHWMEKHKKEAQWLFRGYACAICLDSFTNKKFLETHVQERHHVQYVDQCMLLQCIPCGNHFGNPEDLWQHVLSVHHADFKPSKITQHCSPPAKEDSSQNLDLVDSGSVSKNPESQRGLRRFVCRFCGLKFDLLPDLGRHHQAAHMGASLANARSLKKGIRYYSYKLKSGKLSHPRFKKGLGSASYRIRNRASANVNKQIQLTKLDDIKGMDIPSEVSQATNLGRLAEPQCSAIAKALFSKVQTTKPHPNSIELLTVARFTCCKTNLHSSLEARYGALPQRLYLKAAKLCSENNIQVEWHREGFICPNGCKPWKDFQELPPLTPASISVNHKPAVDTSGDDELETDECHYIIDSCHIGRNPSQNSIILCDDISFGKEPVKISCVVDEGFMDLFCLLANGSYAHNSGFPMPWENFTYVMKPLMDHPECLVGKSLQLGCACSDSSCSSETCDHVYLFSNDYEDAKDIYGRPMHRRFPYDEKGHLILEVGYLVYECNDMCSCGKTCPNRVLQHGVQVKLEVFKTERKGWAVRAGEPILRGTFVCEYIGEVIDEQEANYRQYRYGIEGCSYVYKVDSHANDVSRLCEEQIPYMIDATKYGNVSRFINHSCSPNLVGHQVLVESMDSQLAHIGFYARQDIAFGEELTYDFRYELLPGEGSPCHCGAPKCRGRLS